MYIELIYWHLGFGPSDLDRPVNWAASDLVGDQKSKKSWNGGSRWAQPLTQSWRKSSLEQRPAGLCSSYSLFWHDSMISFHCNHRFCARIPCICCTARCGGRTNTRAARADLPTGLCSWIRILFPNLRLFLRHLLVL